MESLKTIKLFSTVPEWQEIFGTEPPSIQSFTIIFDQFQIKGSVHNRNKYSQLIIVITKINMVATFFMIA